ncbi:MAG: acyl carrier protein [Solirubrobacteraceae bacterium]|nr:acyl carrier protein [Solirubrobacteraceae bacterium]
MSTTTDIDTFVITTLQSFGTEADVTADATLEELDIDSLDLAELAQLVEEEVGVTLESKDLKEIKTVGDVIATVKARQA